MKDKHKYYVYMEFSISSTIIICVFVIIFNYSLRFPNRKKQKSFSSSLSIVSRLFIPRLLLIVPISVIKLNFFISLRSKIIPLNKKDIQ